MAKKFEDTSIEEISLMTMDAFSIIAMVGIIMAVVFSMLGEKYPGPPPMQKYRGDIDSLCISREVCNRFFDKDIFRIREPEIYNFLCDINLDDLGRSLIISGKLELSNLSESMIQNLNGSPVYDLINQMDYYYNYTIMPRTANEPEYEYYSVFLSDSLKLAMLLQLTAFKSTIIPPEDRLAGWIWRGHHFVKRYEWSSNTSKYSFVNTFSQDEADRVFNAYFESFGISNVQEENYETLNGLANIDSSWKETYEQQLKIEVSKEYKLGETVSFFTVEPNQISAVKKMFGLTKIEILDESYIKEVGFSVIDGNFGIKKGDFLYFIDKNNKLAFSYDINMYLLKIANVLYNQVKIKTKTVQ